MTLTEIFLTLFFFFHGDGWSVGGEGVLVWSHEEEQQEEEEAEDGTGLKALR